MQNPVSSKMKQETTAAAAHRKQSLSVGAPRRSSPAEKVNNQSAISMKLVVKMEEVSVPLLLFLSCRLQRLERHCSTWKLCTE